MQAQLSLNATNQTAILQTVIFQSVVKLLRAAHFKVHQNVQWLRGRLKLQKRNQLLQVMQRLAAQAKQKQSPLLQVTAQNAAQAKRKQSPLLQVMQIATLQIATKRKKLVAQWQVASK
jgi:hypothetical protein